MVRTVHNANFPVSVSFLGLQKLSDTLKLIGAVLSRAAKRLRPPI